MHRIPTATVNFGQLELGTKITSPQISSDGYGVTNLLTNTSNGFMVEHFIKPPVFIEVEFICNVFVHEIVINTRVGTQKSKGIEIITNNTTVGRCFLDPKQDVVRWVRTRNTDTNIDQSREDTISLCNFYSGAHRHLNSIRKITIKLFKTENSSLACIKNLKIFGSINKKTNNQGDFQKYENLLNKIPSNKNINLSPYTEKSIPIKRCANSERNECLNRNCTSDDISIPEDFIDPITHELMTNPIILPCGKIIDKSTLDKYVEIELCWNRLPNDPFTHVKFNQFQKPILAILLKRRIDKFLIINSHNKFIGKCPRTFQNSKTTDENLIFKIIETQKVHNTTESKGVSKRKHSPNKTDNHNAHSEVKRMTRSHDQFLNYLSVQNNCTIKSNCKSQTEEQNTRSECNTNNAGVQFKYCVDLTKNTKVTDSIMSNDDLEKKIQNTLKNLPSFLVDSSQNSSTLVKTCFQCSQDHNLYKIMKCSHYICRQCLETKRYNSCVFCGINFISNDVVKIFNS